MTYDKQIYPLIIVMTTVVLIVEGLTLFILYNTSFEKQRDQLIATVRSQAALITAVANYDLDHGQPNHKDAKKAANEETFSQLQEAYNSFKGFGKTGELVIGTLEGNKIKYLIRSRHRELPEHKEAPTLMGGDKAKLLQQALSKRSGTTIAKDYVGKMTLGAYEYIKPLDYGVVVKIDLDELRAPFIQVGILSLAVALMLIILGAYLFRRITLPMVKYLQESADYHRMLFESSPIGLALSSMDGMLVDINQSYANIIGRTIEEAKKLTYWDITPEEYGNDEATQLEKLNTTGSYGPYEKEYIHKEGHRVPVRLSGQIIKRNNETYIWSSVENIVESKQAEENAYLSESRLNEAQRLAKVGSWELDLLTGELIWSDEIFNIFEIDKEKFTASYDAFLEGIHPDDRDKVNVAYTNSLETRQAYEIVHRLQMSDGTIKYVHEACESFFKDDKPVRSVGTVQDITQLHKIEQELKSAMILNELVINASPIGIVIYNEIGQCISANESTATIIGATLEQVLQQNYNKTESWKKSGLINSANRAVESGIRQRNEFEVSTTFGKHATFDCMFVPFSLNDKKHLLLMIDDVTERKDAEKELENIFDISMDMIGAGNLQGYFSKINSSFKRVLGYENEEFMAKSFIEYVYEEDLEATVGVMKEAAAGKKDLYAINRYKCKDGSLKWVEWNIVADVEENTFYATGRDITERKQVEMVLKDSEERLRMAMSAAEIGTWRWDVVTNKDTRDASFNRILGLEEVESTQLVDDFVERVHPDDRAAVAQELQRSIDDRDIYLDEFRIVRPDGVERWLRDQGLPYYDEQNKISYMTGAVVDITEHKHAEDELAKHRNHLEELVEDRTKELQDAQNELVRKERLATLGQLTATVSHELRNPLGAMRPSLYLIEKKSDKEDEPLQKAIERVDRNIDRCDRIIDELLDFTRIIEINKTSVQIDKWLESVIDEQLIPKGVKLEKDFSLNEIQLDVDTERLRRAIINVFDNACHSMMDDNQQLVTKKNSQITINTAINNQRIEINVTDTGAGISDDILLRIFEPLFSTKGFGVGLGMPTVKQIMEQHLGGIEIKSKEGKGTAVTLWLPCTIKGNDIEAV